MADFATPSAATMSSIDASADANKPAARVKPEKPDDAAFKADEAKKRKELDNANSRTQELLAKFNASRPNKDSPTAIRQAELKSELSGIRKKQQEHKTSKGGVNDRITALEGQLKTKIADLNSAKTRMPFKNMEELNQRIASLTAQVDSGKMKIVDEKKSLGEISSLNRQKKDFAGFETKQKEIDSIKQKISETKKELNNPEATSLNASYDQKKAELDKLMTEQDAAYENRNASRAEWEASKARQNEMYHAFKKFQGEYYKKRDAYRDWDREARRQQNERYQAEIKARDLERRKRHMEEELEAAKAPAYIDHIHACDSLIRILDPSSSLVGQATAAISQFAATAQRMVDDSGITGTKIASKKTDEEENYFVGTGGKKGKKGKKVRGAAAATGTQTGSPTSKAVDIGLFYTPGVSEHFELIGVKAPSSAEDQPRVLEEVREKKKYYEENQDKKTAENIAAVQKKFDNLEPNTNGSLERTNGVSASSNGKVKHSDKTNEVSEQFAKTELSENVPAIPAAASSETVATEEEKKVE